MAVADPSRDTEGGARGEATKPVSSLHVLAVDDDRVQQILLEAMLKRAGCTVDLAADGRAAKELWLQHRHTIVITDLHMPVTGGIEFAKWLRVAAWGDSVRLIGTCAPILCDREAAFATGISRLLQKPVQQASIDEAVEESQAPDLQAPVGSSMARRGQSRASDALG